MLTLSIGTSMLMAAACQEIETGKEDKKEEPVETLDDYVKIEKTSAVDAGAVTAPKYWKGNKSH